MDFILKLPKFITGILDIKTYILALLLSGATLMAVSCNRNNDT